MDTTTTQKTDTIIDGQIIEEPVVAPSDNDTSVATNGADVLLNLESLIKEHVKGIDKRKAEKHEFQEMISNTLLNDSTYQEHDKIAKEAAKVRSATKSQLMKQPMVQNASLKAKELGTEIKEMEDALSEYLREYERLSGSNEIETDDGDVREIVYTARLIKKSSIQAK